MESLFDRKLVDALVSAKTNTPEICCQLHSAYHDRSLPEALIRQRLTEARARVEKILVAILAAEQSIAPATKSEPSNVVQIADVDPEYQRKLDAVAFEIGVG